MPNDWYLRDCNDFYVIRCNCKQLKGHYQLACGEEECFILNVDNGVAKMLVKGPKDDDWEDEKNIFMHKFGQSADFQ